MIEKVSMCGYRCDLCRAFAPNIESNDERKALSSMWSKYYDLSISSDKIYCDGCRADGESTKRLDMECPVRKCVIKKLVDHCGECMEFPCEVFREREGLSFHEAYCKLGENFSPEEFMSYLVAFDNMTRLKEYVENQRHKKNETEEISE